MSAIQPATLPTAATLLMALEPANGLSGELGFEAQFSALLGTLSPDGPPAAPAGAPPQATPGHASRSLRGGKEAAASGKTDGKTGGKILPDGLAGLASGSADAAPQDDELLAGNQSVQPEAAALLLPLIAAPAQSPAAPQPAGTAVALAVAARGTSATAAPQVHERAVASTAPATATAAATPMHRALPGEKATMPPAEIAPAEIAPAEIAKPAAVATTPREAEPSGQTRPAIAILPIPLEALRLFRQAPAAAAPAAAAPAGPDAAATLPGEQVRAIATTGGAAAPQTPATLQLLGEAAAGSMPIAAAAQAQKSPEAANHPAVIDAALPDLAAGNDGIAAISTPAPAPGQIPATPPVQSGAPQAHDFAALIDRLVEARHAVQSTLSSQTVQASVQHAEFGRVALNFQQDAAGLTVTFANPDPDLARAVQSLTVPAASASTGSGNTNDSGANTARQDWQGGNTPASGQPQGQSPSPQQRGALVQRDSLSATGQPHGTPDETTSTPSAPRNGIFA